MTTTLPTQAEPTSEQLAYASKYAADHKLHDGVFVLVDFDGQTSEAVMCGSQFSLWVERQNALDVRDLGNCGNAVFRVYPDGRFHRVDETM